MANSSLTAIQQKIRRLTRTPSISQLSDAAINEYINTYIAYDLPSSLRLFNLRTVLTWYTQAYVDTYPTAISYVTPTDPLYNFNNIYSAVHPPIYIAGVQAFYTQERDVFYGYWPQTSTIADTQLRGTGNPATNFVGTLTYPCAQKSINFNCLDINGNTMVLVDAPISATLGQLIIPVNPEATGVPTFYGTIAYQTGAYNLTFPATTQLGATVWSEVLAYQPGKPVSMLYYNDQFVLRPIPDKVYAVQIEADIRPTQLLATNPNTSPQLEQWWQLIALGSSIKLLQDRMDMDTVNLLMPEYRKQENMALRTTLTQQANERTVTIYTQGRTTFYWGFMSGGWPY